MDALPFFSRLRVLSLLALAFLAVVFDGRAVTPGAGPGGVGTTDGVSELELWVKADGLSLANGAPVANWPDASGNGRALIPPSAGVRPNFLANVLGGKPVVRFTADYFNSLTLPSVGNEMSFVAVIKPAATGTYQNIIDDEPSTRPMLWVDPSRNYEFNFNTGAVAPAGPGYDVVFAIKRNTAPQYSQLFLNGPAVTSGGPNNFTVPSSQVYDLFNRDNGQAFSGDVAELIIYSTALTQAEIDRIGYYLQQKYGLATDFPPPFPVLRSYEVNPATYIVDAAIAPNAPRVIGGHPTSYSVSPALPPGLILDPATGVISGTPTSTAPRADYVVTATSSGNPSSQVTLSLAVITPTLAGYSREPAVFTRTRAGRPLQPVLQGGTAAGFTVSPRLPTGLVLDPATGVISGTPTEVASAASYVVTASFNGYPSSSYVLSLEVLDFSTSLDISEFLASNDLGLADGDGGHPDWIELHNYGAVAIDLDGWSLTDSLSDLRKWVSGPRVLAPGAYLVVFASGDARIDPAGNPHTGFKLDAGGEELALVQPDGVTIVRQFAPFPQQDVNISYGTRDRITYGFFATPTPGAANGFFDSLSARVIASPAGGTFSGTRSVTLSAPLSGDAVIRYTLNGTPPTGSSPIYSGPLLLSNNARLRARVFQSGFNAGPETSEVYLRLGADLQNFSSNLPMVFLNTDSTIAATNSPTLTGASSVIVGVNASTGRAPAGGVANYAGRSGLRLRGRSSSNFPQKQFKFETWDGSGRETEAPLLGLAKGSDWVLYAPYTDKSLVRNALAYRSWERFGWPSIGTRFVEVFVNDDGDTEFTYADDYAGIYMLVEAITLDRIDLEEPRTTNVNGGFITETGNADDQDFSTTGSGRSVAHRHRDPGANQLNSAQTTWVRNYLADFERALYGTGFVHPTTGLHYSHYTNVSSQVDYKIAREWSRNFDGGSTYHYIPRGKKLTMGPLWDYNWAFGNVNYAEGGDLPGYRTDGWNRSFTAAVNGWAPWWLRFEQDPDWWQQFIDRWTELRGGLLSDATVNSHIDSLTAPLAVEAAARHFTRWPQLGMFTVISPPGYETRTTYQSEVNYLKSWLQSRSAWIDSQFPPRPTFSPSPGSVPSGSTITLSAGAGQTIYYSRDGSDPRMPGGGVHPSAQSVPSGGSVVVSASALINARARNGTVWGAPALGGFVTGTSAGPANLVITEIAYHPADPTPQELAADPTLGDDDFEFLELRNIGSAAIDLTGAYFSEGIRFVFPAGTVLAAGAYLVVVENGAAFALRHGNGANVAGQYSGNLDNDGDTVVLHAADGAEIARAHYRDTWTPAADGAGYSLVLRNADSIPSNYSEPAVWALSGTLNGSPGTANGAVVSTDFTLWQQSHFSSSDLADPLRSGPLGDPDGDRVPNLLEMAFHTAPLDPGSRPAQSLTISGSEVVLIFTRLRQTLGVTYQFEESPDAAVWSVVTAPFEVLSQTSHTEAVRVTVPRGATGARFFRLRVTKQ